MTVSGSTAAPNLFDAAARRRGRDRAAPLIAEAGHLHQAAADGIADRLEMVTRGFPDAAVLAAGNGAYGAALRGRFGIAQLREIEDAPRLAARIGAEAGALEAPPFAPESLDLIVVGLGLHAVNDPVGALSQIRLALRPDGLMLAAAFGGRTLHELRAALAEAEAEISGGLSPRVAPMAEIREWGGALQRAGFALPVADADLLTVWQATPLHLMRDLRAMGEGAALSGRLKSFTRRDLFARACQIYADAHTRADGKVPATFELIFLSGWAPAETQQKPLRPGSAAARLADALGTEERSAGEKAGK